MKYIISTLGCKVNQYETQTMEEILDTPRATAIYEGFKHRTASEELCRKCGYARRFQ